MTLASKPRPATTAPGRSEGLPTWVTLIGPGSGVGLAQVGFTVGMPIGDWIAISRSLLAAALNLFGAPE